MDNATNIALSRLVAQTRAMDVTAGNLANTTTPGYRAERMVFSDWLSRQHGGAPSGGGTIVYTQDRATYRDRQAGQLSHTANPLDLALSGDGYFTVLGPGGPRLTRAGHFDLGTDGTVVDEQGNALLDTSGKKLQIPPPIPASRWPATAPFPARTARSARSASSPPATPTSCRPRAPAAERRGHRHHPGGHAAHRPGLDGGEQRRSRRWR